MSNDLPIIYQIQLEGRLKQEWSVSFEGMTVSYTADGNTLLTGPLADQPALHGILTLIRNLNLGLISIQRLQ